MTQKKTSIILCTYNEATYIKETIKQLKQRIENLELIIVDDNSSDNTREIIHALNLNNEIKLLHRKKTRGLASAFHAGLMRCTGEYIGWIDTNMSELVIKFKEMDALLVSGHDIVILSRYIPGGNDERSLLRYATSKYFNIFCSYLLGRNIKDYTSGIFLMKKELLNEVSVLPYGHGEFFIEFLENANRKGYSIKEIPYIQMKEDNLNLSKTASNLFRFFYLGIKYILRIFTIIIRRN